MNLTGWRWNPYSRGDRYVLLETAPATGNYLLALVYAVFACELGRLAR